MSRLVLLALPVLALACAHRPDVTAGTAKPILLHRELLQGMPTGSLQEVRVVCGVLQPGVTTGYHTHRFPLAVYVVEGEFTLEVGDANPVTLKAGEVAVEPPNVRVVGYNAGTMVTRIIDFYVSDPDTPFVDYVSDPDTPFVDPSQ